MRTRAIFTFVFLSLMASSAFGQIIGKNGGSLYSIFGVGDLDYSSSTRTDAMGIMGIALTGDYANGYNPAAWTKIGTTKFSTKFNFASISSTDGINTAKRSYGQFESFDLSVPIDPKNGWVLNLGVHDYSNINYGIQYQGTSLGDQYTQAYTGSGGLSRFSAGLSYIFFKYLSFGAQFNYVFGTVDKTLTINFVDGTLVNTNNTTINALRGISFAGGFIYNGFGKMFGSKKLDDLNLGAYFSSPFHLNSTINGRYITSTATDSVSITTGQLQMPWSFGAGISNTFGKKFVVAADIFTQNWSSYTNYGVHPPEIRNNFRVGAGFEYTPSRRYNDPFFQKVSYRLGGNFTTDYLMLNGVGVNSYSLSIGASLPLSMFNSLDLMFAYSTRGSNTNGLIKDNMFKFGATLMVGELWFLKPQER